MATDGLTLIREVQETDDRRVLRRILANLVSLESDDEQTPLEDILDVLSEVNRATPGAGGAYQPPDYTALIEQMRGFMLAEDRGLERLYDVVQEREIR